MHSMKERMAKIREKSKRKRENTTQGFRDRMHDRIKLTELKSLLDDTEWILDSGGEKRDQYQLTMEGYYGRSTLAGFTDYADHREDTLEELRDMVYEAIENRCMQRGNYYDKDGNAFDSVLLRAVDGGWSAHCIFDGGKGKSFFEWMRS